MKVLGWVPYALNVQVDSYRIEASSKMFFIPTAQWVL